LFHNSNVFGSCIIHILYTGCAKIKKKKIPAPKGRLDERHTLHHMQQMMWGKQTPEPVAPQLTV